MSTLILCLYNYEGFGGMGRFLLVTEVRTGKRCRTGLRVLKDVLCLLGDDGHSHLGSQGNRCCVCGVK